MSGNTKTSVVEQLENICPVCGEQFEAVEFGEPHTWSPAGHVGAAKICQHFQKFACFYHGLDDPSASIEDCGLTPAADYEDDEYDLTFETASEVGEQPVPDGLVDDVLRHDESGPLTAADTESVCPFEAAGWTHEEAERILSIDHRETEMRFGGDSPDSL